MGTQCSKSPFLVNNISETLLDFLTMPLSAKEGFKLFALSFSKNSFADNN